MPRGKKRRSTITKSKEISLEKSQTSTEYLIILGVVIWDASSDKIPGVSWYDGSHSGVDIASNSLDQEFKLYLSNTPCTNANC